MAKLNQDKITITISEMVRNDEPTAVILDADVLEQLLAVACSTTGLIAHSLMSTNFHSTPRTLCSVMGNCQNRDLLDQRAPCKRSATFRSRTGNGLLRRILSCTAAPEP